MSEPFLGEIQIVGFNFPPKGWAQCDGQLLSIAQNNALFALLGTTFGGDGRTTFGLPDLRGRTPINSGDNSAGPGLPAYPQGQKGGAETVTLTTAQIPSHTHTARASDTEADSSDPAGHILAEVPSAFGGAFLYHDAANLGTLHSGSITNTGGSQPHNNMQPYQVVNFIIALTGIFPSRN
jgi:microcystin-dependent protein